MAVVECGVGSRHSVKAATSSLGLTSLPGCGRGTTRSGDGGRCVGVDVGVVDERAKAKAE